MIAMFTETLDDFLSTRETSAEWQDVVTLFGKFPSFDLNIADTSEEHVTDAINFYDLFKLEYAYREIGQAYENQFFHEIKKQLYKALIEYKPKIDKFLENFNDLLNPLVHLEEKTSSSGSSTNSIYLNPLNTTATKLSDHSTNEGEGETTRTYQQQMTYNDTKTKIINEFLELKNIYLSALEVFDSCFMQIY